MSEADGPVVPDDDLRAHVETLKSRGEHAAAAAALWVHGFASLAAAIYEHIFEDERALKAWEAADDVASAMRVALRKGDAEAIERIVEKATNTGRADLLLEMLQADNRHAVVARIHEGRSDLEHAAAAYERAERWGKAASCRERMGDLRGAGMLYERHLEADPGHPESCFRLGRILTRFSRHDDGIALLQRAIKGGADQDEMLCRASPTLVLSFTSLGYDDAARSVWTRWQEAAGRRDDDVPASLEDFLRSDSAAAFAAVVARQRDDTAAAAAPQPSGLDAFFDEAAADVGVDEARRRDVEAQGMLLAGRYLLGEPLGGGGVGQVFRAHDAFTDQPVAVKIFGSQAMQSQAVQAYALEARAASSLDHPAITPLVELNMPQGYVVTELVEGESVEQRLVRGGDAGWLRPFAAAILGLLAACHRTGIVHGALKPTNVFLVTGGIRLVDFGAHHLLALRSTETGGLSSVWPYLAPEQLFGAAADVSGDLYASAAMLYRGLTGRPPFARPEDDRRAAPPLPSLARAELAGAWDIFLMRALAPEPKDRFTTSEGMLEAMPDVPPGLQLPSAASLAGTDQGAQLEEATDRYAKGPLIYRDGDRARVYEGRDRTVARPVWLIECDDADALLALAACARLNRGLQPVYDVLPDAGRVIVARDAAHRAFDLEALRDAPQALARDLSAVAGALQGLHEAGLALDGFESTRLRGPVGPRIRLAPARIPVVSTPAALAADWRAFDDFVDEAFGSRTPSNPAETGEAEGARGRMLATLLQRRYISAADVAEVSREASWPALLDAVGERLLASTPGRVMARLVRSVIRGED